MFKKDTDIINKMIAYNNPDISKIRNIFTGIKDSDNVVIYGAGEHTYNLFKYTNIKEKNIIYVVDKKFNEITEFDLFKVKNPEEISIDKVDVVVISSFEHQKEIRKYLRETIQYKGKIIEIYDNFDEAPFYSDINISDDEYFGTAHLRPKFSSNINVKSDKIYKDKRIAIVIQGPIISKNDFTLETIRLYKKIFDNVEIIISTWQNESVEQIKKIKDEEVVLILNKIPKYSGVVNINYQIVSTLNGIIRAQDMGIEYVLKTRTDQRIYGKNVKEYLFNIISHFPLRETSIQKERLVVSSLNTFKYRPYSVSDMFMFGGISDMILYWKVDLEKEDKKLDTANKDTFKKWMRDETAECYLLKSFMRKIGKNPKDTISDSWNVYSENFCVVNKCDLDLYWYKYDFKYKEFKYLNYDYNRNSEELSYKEWFNLYCGLKNKEKIDEDILDEEFGDTL